MTRLWPNGSPIQVVQNGEGLPEHLVWQGQKYAVVEITRRWRIRSDWWRELLWRDYFKLITDRGLLIIIFHDLQEDAWYVQHLFD
jgi:Domain of unknown function (DUF6504)